MQAPKLANEEPNTGIHAYLYLSVTDSQCFRRAEAQEANHTQISKEHPKQLICKLVLHGFTREVVSCLQ